MEYIKLSVESLEVIELLGDAEKGRLFASLLKYAKTGEAPQLGGNERFVFPVLKLQIDQDAEKAEKAEKISEVRREAGKKGAQAKSSKTQANVKQNSSKTQANVKQNSSKTQANVKQNSSKIKQNKHLPDLLDFACDLPEAREKEDGFPLCPPSPSSPEPPLSLSPYNPPSPEEKESVGADKPPATRTALRFVKPTVNEVRVYCQENGYSIDPEHFVDYYEARGWMLNNSKMKDWKAAVRTWVRNDKERGSTGNGKAANSPVQTQRYGLYL